MKKTKQKGSAIVLILGAIVILASIGYVGSTIYTSIIGGMQKTNLVIQTAQTITQAAYTISTETNKNSSGIPVASPYTVATFSPNGGGQIPSSSAAPKNDSFGSPLGYCVNNAISQADPVFAVISSGIDKTFQTSCSQAFSGITLGDDKIVIRSVANILQGVGGTVYFGDPVAKTTDLGILNPVQKGEFRLVNFDGSAWTNKTGTPGQSFWTQVGSSSVSSFSDDIGLIVQASYSSFNTNNPKFLPADGSTYASSNYPLLSTRTYPSLIGATYNIIQRTLPANSIWSSVSYGNGTFVTVGNGSSNAATSSDGINWTLRTLPTNSSWNSITYGNGIFLATTSNTNRAATSTDGITWTNRTLIRIQNNIDSIYGNGLFMILPNGSRRIQFSSDGINFTSPNANVIYNMSSAISFGNGIFVITENSGGDGTAVTTDGINFTYGTILGLGLPWSAITYGNGKFVALANGTNIGATSTDGINWIQVNLPATANWSDIAYGNGIFTAISTGSNIVIFSSDGINWIQKAMPVVSNWKSIISNGSIFSVISNTNSNIAATINITSPNFIVPAISNGYFFIKALP